MDNKISNEETINDIIKELNINEPNESDIVKEIDPTVNAKNPQTVTKENIAADLSSTENLVSNCISEDSESKSSFVVDDIDDDTLKSIEESLSDENKERNRQTALEFKLKGNEEFKTGNYFDSINIYTKALNICPLSFKTDRSIFYCNRAAAKIKLDRNETAADDCTKAIELNPNYLKAYLRRARLYETMDKLDDSLNDFKKILELDPANNEARAATIRLPPIIHERNEKLKEEMLGKLKDLGNMVLRPFGLSTDNFKLQQDPNTGGYSVNFQQNSKS